MTKYLIFLFLISLFSSCSSGWSFMNYQLTPSDTTKNTVLIEIVAHDSTKHYYAKTVFHGDNWCYLHNEWENVKIQ